MIQLAWDVLLAKSETNRNLKFHQNPGKTGNFNQFGPPMRSSECPGSVARAVALRGYHWQSGCSVGVGRLDN